jgi:signal peptidase II
MTPTAPGRPRFLIPWLHLLIFSAVLLADQATKLWARLAYSLPNGEPDSFLSTPVIGEWVQFRLVYNLGAAFGLRPQSIVPFLHPTLFYLVFSLAAIVFLTVYYRRLPPGERSARLGVLLILAGAFGNLIDRVTLHKVTDFIDVGIPGVHPRWPVFNIADSSVCVGIAFLILSMWTADARSAGKAEPAKASEPA